MKKILILSTNENAISILRTCLSPDYSVVLTRDLDKCLEHFRKRRFEFLFMDITIPDFENHEKNIDFQKVFEPFWKAYPTSPPG